MSERKYSVVELDALRKAVEDKELWGYYSGPRGMSGSSRSYSSGELERIVEQRVRTHMLAGHTAEELRASDRPVHDGAGLKGIAKEEPHAH